MSAVRKSSMPCRARSRGNGLDKLRTFVVRRRYLRGNRNRLHPLRWEWTQAWQDFHRSDRAGIEPEGFIVRIKDDGHPAVNRSQQLVRRRRDNGAGRWSKVWRRTESR